MKRFRNLYKPEISDIKPPGKAGNWDFKTKKYLATKMEEIQKIVGWNDFFIIFLWLVQPRVCNKITFFKKHRV